ncbi:glycosyl hydrolase family 18 protein [Ornithinibacillus contaminans]|uniref:glycosyl hydrolase family 18 protein n=1 Tax=Ornithinibacillus contaminans TaxID=694055 RepID=UPI00064D8A95|nr:glycosyl hydrolase family 18 protein [Ornithinibacillus contaminans]
MTFDFRNLEIVEVKDGQVILQLKLPTSKYDTEFSTEFLASKLGKQNLKDAAREVVKKNLPRIKVATVVIMAGSVVLASFPINKAEAHEIDFNMSYLYFGNTQSYISQIDQTQGNLNHVAPSYFDINPDGSLLVTKQYDPAFVSEMHKRGIKVVPFLSNHWDRTIGRAALQNREKLAQQIAEFIMKNNLDGVQIDIENVTEIDRDNYTDLVRLIQEKLPDNKEVSVAVAANPNGWTKGWHGSYDYEELAKYSDYLMIMAYDESYTGGPEGPVASYGWVERSIQYALNQGVPSEKVVLGIPFYGRFWKEGATSGGVGISNKRVDELLAKYGGKVTFDEASKSPMATITVNEGDPPTTIAGNLLTPGTYHIWYENNESLQAKLQLLHKYDLKGTGSWSLGQENTAIWQNYRSWVAHDGIAVQPSVPEQPKEQIGTVQPSETHSYTVKSGDSLWKIATQFKLTVNQLKEYNQLTTDVIFVGQVLSLIPKTQPGADQIIISNPIASTPGAITAPATPVQPPKTTAPSTKVSLVGKYMVPKATNTYMRSAASSKNKIVKTLKTSDSLKVIQEYTDKSKVSWLKVQTGSTTGWVLASQVKTKPATTASTLVGKYMVPIVTKSYMRSAASTKNKIVKTLKTTDSLKVIQEYTDKSKVKWLKVQSGSTTGWVVASQVKTKPATTVSTLIGKYMVPKVSKTYMRSAASSKNKIVKTLKTTDSVKVIQEYTDKSKVKWLKVQSGSTTGWVVASQVKTKPATTTPAKKYTVLKYGLKGTAVKELQTKLKKNGVYKKSINGSYDAATKAAVIAFQKKYKLLVDGIAGPQTQSKLDAVVK